MSALATFDVDHRPAMFSILLAGFDPETDAILVRATQETMTTLFGINGTDWGPSLVEIPERPVVIDVPDCAGLRELEVFRLIGLSRCLATAFFNTQRHRSMRL